MQWLTAVNDARLVIGTALGCRGGEHRLRADRPAVRVRRPLQLAHASALRARHAVARRARRVRDRRPDPRIAGRTDRPRATRLVPATNLPATILPATNLPAICPVTHPIRARRRAGPRRRLTRPPRRPLSRGSPSWRARSWPTLGDDMQLPTTPVDEPRDPRTVAVDVFHAVSTAMRGADDVVGLAVAAPSRPTSTTRPATSPSAPTSQTRTTCCVTVRPAPSDPPEGARRHRHPPAGDLRDSRQQVRLRDRARGEAGRPAGKPQAAGDGHEPAAEHDKPAAEHGEPAAEHGGKPALQTATDGVVRQRQIVIQDELDDIYVIKSGPQRERQDHPRGDSTGSRRRQGGIRVAAARRGSQQPEVSRGIGTSPMFARILHRPALAIVISLLILFLGGLAIKTLPISQFPDVAPPSVRGLGVLSRRQRQRPGRLGPDHPGAVHQRRPGHALHGLRRHQRRRGGDHDLLRAGHGPERRRS